MLVHSAFDSATNVPFEHFQREPKFHINNNGLISDSDMTIDPTAAYLELVTAPFAAHAELAAQRISELVDTTPRLVLAQCM